MLGQAAGELFDSPARYLTRHPTAPHRNAAELVTLALIRTASNDPDAAARLLDERWERVLPADLSAWAWTSVGAPGRDAAAARGACCISSAPISARPPRRGRTSSAKGSEWSDDTLAWKVRAALRASIGTSVGVARATAIGSRCFRRSTR